VTCIVHTAYLFLQLSTCGIEMIKPGCEFHVKWRLYWTDMNENGIPPTFKVDSQY
jgi:hypothetical protein